MKRQLTCLFALFILSAGSIYADVWDSVDDTGAGATLLDPSLTMASNGPHTLSSTDLYDWYKIPMTNGYFYSINSIGGTGDNYANIYSDVAGTINVANNDDSGGNGQFSIANFQPSSSGTYYLRIRTYSLGNNWTGYIKFKYSKTMSDTWDPGDNTPSGATVLTPAIYNQSQGMHSLSSSDTNDWYKIYMTNSATYYLYAGNSSGFASARLYNSTASVIRTEDLTNFSFNIAFTPATSGYYYLKVIRKNGFSSWQGSLYYYYVPLADEWDPVDNTKTGATVLITTNFNQWHGLHVLNSSDTNDWYKTYLTYGRSYTFSSIDYNGFASARLYNSTGTTIMTQNLTSSPFIITYIPPSSGFYYLKMIRRSGTTEWRGYLSYIFAPLADDWDSLDDTSAGATSIVPSTSYQSHGLHVLNSTDTNDWYKIHMTNTRSYHLYANNNNGYASARLYNSSTTTIVTQDLTSYSFNLTFTPSVSGDYYLKVIRKSGYTAWQGYMSYSFTPLADDWDPADNTSAGATVIVPSSSYQNHGLHILNSMDTNDWFKIYMTNTRSYQFSTGDLNGYASAQLYDPTISSVVAQDLTGYSFNILYIPPSSGYYYLKVTRRSGYTTWFGELSFYYTPSSDNWDPSDNTSAGATVITPSGSYQSHGQHVLNSTDTNDWFMIHMTNNYSYNFSSSTYSGSASARLFDSTATNIIAQDLASYYFDITYTPSISGNYYLKLVRRTGYANWRGYLQYSCQPLSDDWDPLDDTWDQATLIVPTPSPQYHGDHILNSMDTNDWFKIYMTPGRNYILESYDYYYFASARLYNPTLTSVVAQDLSGYSCSINYIPQISGYYYLQFIRKAGYPYWRGGLNYYYELTPESDVIVENRTAVYPTVVDMNQSSLVRFISGDIQPNVDIRIYSLRGNLIETFSGVNLSSGVFETTLDSRLYPAGRYYAQIGEKTALFVVLK